MPATNRLALSNLSAIRRPPQYCREGARSLHRAPYFQFARQRDIGPDHSRQRQAQMAESALQQVGRALLPEQARKIPEHLVEVALDAGALLGFAAAERDRLGVFAQVHQANGASRHNCRKFSWNGGLKRAELFVTRVYDQTGQLNHQRFVVRSSCSVNKSMYARVRIFGHSNIDNWNT